VDLQLQPGTPHGLSIALMAGCDRPGLPIIFVTGYPEVARVIPSDMGSVLLKPVDLELLVEAVRDRLNNKPCLGETRESSLIHTTPHGGSGDRFATGRVSCISNAEAPGHVGP